MRYGAIGKRPRKVYDSVQTWASFRLHFACSDSPSVKCFKVDDYSVLERSTEFFTIAFVASSIIQEGFRVDA